MFHITDQMRKAVICQICKQVFVDPRNLPCGHSVCNNCIKPDADNESHFKCHCCNEMHILPQNGFPVSQVMASFLEKNT
jgi:tripartite motif-containing protein 2/3